MVQLRNMFGNSTVLPGKVIVTKWNTDNFTKGAYSFNAVGMKKNDRKILAKPVKKKLYFAGEATHHKYFQTTNGAYLTGKSAAQKVLDARKED